jgi:hypothetical protein
MADEIPEIPLVPEGLREAAQRGTLIPFVGAGASKLAGCPNWADVVFLSRWHFSPFMTAHFSQPVAIVD